MPISCGLTTWMGTVSFRQDVIFFGPCRNPRESKPSTCAQQVWHPHARPYWQPRGADNQPLCHQRFHHRGDLLHQQRTTHQNLFLRLAAQGLCSKLFLEQNT